MAEKETELARNCPRCGRLQQGSLMAGVGSEAYWHADGTPDDCNQNKNRRGDPMTHAEEIRDIISATKVEDRPETIMAATQGWQPLFSAEEGVADFGFKFTDESIIWFTVKTGTP